MSHVSAQAIPTLEQPLRGIHLLWNGPAAMLFAPGGWQIERKRAGPNDAQAPPSCDEIVAARLQLLRQRLELKVALGWVRLTPGAWPGPESGPCEVFTLDLDTPASGVLGRYRGRHALAIGLHRGKAVGFRFLFFALDGREFDFGSARIDQVLVYGLRAQALRWCVRAPLLWRGGEVIARLQVPLREFSPELAGSDDELGEAKSRLIAAETIDPARFEELADILRVALTGPGRRPIDNLLRMKNLSEEPEQMSALDPLRALIVSPTWRRVMGLAFIDRDPALTPGERYDYRISGSFPTSEIGARVFGFHTIPPGTTLPDHFLLDGCRFRLPNPLVVRASPSIPPSGSQWATRLGIALAPRNSLPWRGFGIEEFSVSIDLPEPVEKLVLELDPGHDLKFVAGHAGGPMTSPQPVPDGTRPMLQFPMAVTRVNLSGEGFLFAVRITSDDGEELRPLATVLEGVEFGETPLPAEPLEVTAKNLQKPQEGAVLGTNRPVARTLHMPGIDVQWRPAPARGAPIWPIDLSVPIPLDAAVFEVERRVDPNGPFTPVLSGHDNLVLGSRDEPPPSRVVQPGTDVMALYPEEAPAVRGRDRFSYADAFRDPDDANPARTDAPPPGTMLRYRVRTVDAIGRGSESWRESSSVRLEKHEAPPAPAAFDPVPADEMTAPGFTGVYAKVLVGGSAELSTDELAQLGEADNAIVLRWGWHAAQRAQDPFATEFRVYLSRTFDALPAQIVSATAIGASPGDAMLEVQVPASISANAAAGLSLFAGYPFFIVEHTGGTLVSMLVRTRIPDHNGAFRLPPTGPVSVPLKLSPSMTRPKSWTERFVFPSGQSRLPITGDARYEVVIRDRLLLSPEHPRDSLWVGVSSADSEPYVADAFPLPGPDGPLPGNESPVVAVRCDGRRAHRPQFSPPPPAGPVPRLLTAEPSGGAPVKLRLDLGAHVAAAALTPGELVQPERASVSELFGTLGVTGGQLVATAAAARDSGAPPQPLSLPNPGDQALVIAAVREGASESLDDRLAVGIAAAHPYADTLFTSATPSPVPFSEFEQTLPADEARYLYRVRRADAIARLSVAAALVNAVVRVPSPVPGASPRLAPSEAGDPAGRLRLRVPADPRLTDVLVFEHPSAPGARTVTQLLRVGNRPELGAEETVRLRLDGGAVVTPSIVSLTQALEDEQGWLLTIDVEAEAGEAVNVWASTVTLDRIPSPPGGPWRLSMPPAPLSAPALAVAASAGALVFSWTLPDPLITQSWLEVSADGRLWGRASSIRSKPAAAATVAAGTAPRHFRVIVASQDGRRAVSNAVVA